MSTNYYYIREPFHRIEIESNEKHDLVKIWESGVCAGSLVVSPGVGRKVALMFADVANDIDVPMSTYWGGDKRGCVVAEQVRGLDPDLQLISEYGEPITVREIRAMAGKGKRDEA